MRGALLAALPGALPAALSSALLAAAMGCAHTVTIDSDPAGAEVLVDGVRIGETPLTWVESTGWERVYELEVRKPGHRTVRRRVRQTEWSYAIVGAGACCSALLGTPLTIVGGLPLVSIFWARQLPDELRVTLRPLEGPAAAEPDGAAGDGGAEAAPAPAPPAPGAPPPPPAPLPARAPR
jgi:hypothetical protein